jgi:hypothetical protein
MVHIEISSFFQMMNFLAAEHGKGVCDGEAAVIKRFIRDLFASGSLLVMHLAQIIDLLRAKLSFVKQGSNNLHSISHRKFFAVPSKCF